MTLLFCSMIYIPTWYIATIILAEKKNNQPTPLKRTLTLFSSAFFTFLLTAATLLFLAMNSAGGILATVILFGIYAIYFVFGLVSHSDAKSRSDRMTKAMELVAIALFQLPGILIVYIYLSISPDANASIGDELPSVLLSIALAAMIIHTSGMFFIHAWIGEPKGWQMRAATVLFLIVIPFILATIFKVPSMFSYLVVNNMKIGNFHSPDVTIDKAACDIISEKGFNACTLKIGQHYKLCDAYFLTAVGDPLYLKLNVPSTDPKKARRVIDIPLPKKYVLGWKYDVSTKRFSQKGVNDYAETMHSICDVQPEVQQKTVQSLKDSELFEFDKASLTPPGMGKLDQFVADIKTKYKTKSQIEIVGYADRIGTPNYNMTLSQRRAAEVAIYLKKKFANDSKFQDIRLVS